MTAPPTPACSGDAENPGPGHVTTAMSDAGHDRTRLGSQEYVHARQ
jgi:hypothetical protein